MRRFAFDFVVAMSVGVILMLCMGGCGSTYTLKKGGWIIQQSPDKGTCEDDCYSDLYDCIDLYCYGYYYNSYMCNTGCDNDYDDCLENECGVCVDPVSISFRSVTEDLALDGKSFYCLK